VPGAAPPSRHNEDVRKVLMARHGTGFIGTLHATKFYTPARVAKQTGNPVPPRATQQPLRTFSAYKDILCEVEALPQMVSLALP
jgi:hypothetical protein